MESTVRMFVDEEYASLPFDLHLVEVEAPAADAMPLAIWMISAMETRTSLGADPSNFEKRSVPSGPNRTNPSLSAK